MKERISVHNVIKKRLILSAGAFLALILVFCGRQMNTGNEELTQNTPARVDTGFVVTNAKSYDSADTAVISSINEDESTITFLNLEIGRRYTLEYDGTSSISDKYGNALSLSQISPGSIADVRFLKSKKHLTSMNLSAAAWEIDNVDNYEINDVKKEIIIGQETYKFTEDTQYFSDGKKIEPMELNAADILDFKGMDTTILSITVQRGHGYLRLSNAENFFGGWIDVGQIMFSRISEDMLLTVPEGMYEVTVSNNGNDATKPVEIVRNKETTLDLGDIIIESPKEGTVLFSVTPTDAELFIDGEPADYSAPVQLLYGIHQIIARREGYQTVTQYLRVGEENAGVSITLDVERDTSDSEDTVSSNNTVSENNTVSSNNTTSSYYKIYIDAPEEAEVYFDGSYVGIAPTSFKIYIFIVNQNL